jgi:tetratricopeptide (TPR) repeat protein
MCSFIPLDALAQAYCQRAVQAAQAAADVAAETWVLLNCAMVHMQAARWADMRQCLEKARDLAKELGFSRRWEEGVTIFSTGCLMAGRFEEAGRHNDELLAAIERSDPQSKCWANVRQAELYLVRGDVPAALAASALGEAICRQDLGRAEWIYALGPLALARLRSGDAEGAREAADRCAEWIKGGSAPTFYNVFAYAALVEVYLTLWLESGDAGRRGLAGALRQAMKHLRAIARVFPMASPRLLYWSGMRALRVDGEREQAAQLFRESLDRARSLDMPYDEGMALAALGEHGGGPVEQRQRMLFEAQAVLRAIGAHGDARRAEAAASRAASAA